MDHEALQRRAYEIEWENKQLLAHLDTLNRRITEALSHLQYKYNQGQSLTLKHAIEILQGGCDEQL